MSFLDRVKSFLPTISRDYAPVGSQPFGWAYSGGAVAEPFAGAWQQGVHAASSAGPDIFANSSVYSCINIISSDIARMPVQVLRVNPKTNVRELHTQHPAYGLFRNPNSNQTSLQFIQQYVTSKLTCGNTYVLLLRDARGVANEMYVLDPRKVQVLLTEKGDVYYRLGRDPLAGIEDSFTVAATEIVHDRAVTLWHPLIGVGPLFAAGVSAMLSGRIQINAERFFANMSRPSGYLFAPGKIDEKIARRLQTEWEQNYSGKGLGKIAVLTNGLDFKPMNLTAVESETAALLRMTAEEIARVYRVPPFKLGDPSKMTYRNNEQMARDYFNNCLSYHLESFEQCFEKALQLRNGVEIEFDASAMFRLDAESRYTAHKDALNAGWKSVNEVRAEEDLPPVVGGEEPRVQMQYVPLSQVDALTAAANGGSAKPAKESATPIDPPVNADDEKDQGLSDEDVNIFVQEFLGRFSLGAE